MNATEAQIEASYNAITQAIADEVLSGSKMPQDAFLRKLARIALEAVPDVEPDTEADTVNWQDVLDEAILDYVEHEKAEQGFGPLDTGFDIGEHDHNLLAYWVDQFAAPAVRNAVASAKASAS